MEDIYKFNRAYFIRFNKIENDTYLDNYIFPNFAKLLDKSSDKYIAIEEDNNGQDCMILFLEDIKIGEFIRFCTDEDIIDYHEDITKILLLYDNIDDVIIKMIESDEFEDKFHQFFKKNVTIDTILDKIALNGEDSLTEFEFNFLKKTVAKSRYKNLQ